MNEYIQPKIEPEFESVAKYSATIYDEEVIISKGTLLVNYRKDDRPVGLIEDIWTHEDYRKRGLASKIMSSLIERASTMGCYKIVLCCSDDNVSFYHKLNFVKHQNAMRLSLR